VEILSLEADGVHPANIDAEGAALNASLWVSDIRLQCPEAFFDHALLAHIDAVVVCATKLCIDDGVPASSLNLGHGEVVLPTVCMHAGFRVAPVIVSTT
jgi:hypothetical protein